MNRYSVIHTKLPRELLLLQGTGCRWRKCSFCDYHQDTSDDPFIVNRSVLQQVTGIYGTLDIINSGSVFEPDNDTLDLVKRVIREKGIHTVWFEAHYMYRNQLARFASQFAPVQVKFRCGVETFDHELRNSWNKGIPESVSASDIANYFQGVCLLCCSRGENKEHIINDIDTAKQHFEYFSINLFSDNSTHVKRDKHLAEWFEKEIYPEIKDLPGVEILLGNTDLNIG